MDSAKTKQPHVDRGRRRLGGRGPDVLRHHGPHDDGPAQHPGGHLHRFEGVRGTATRKLSRDFRTADHAKLQAKGENAIDMGCESCHGPGSKHKEAGGGAGTIVNPKKSPETCFQCHLDKKAEFMLPYSHPVLSGKMTCGDCHDPHKGSAIKGGGTQLNGKNETCPSAIPSNAVPLSSNTMRSAKVAPPATTRTAP